MMTVSISGLWLVVELGLRVGGHDLGSDWPSYILMSGVSIDTPAQFIEKNGDFQILRDHYY